MKEGPKKGDVKSIRFDLQDPTKVTAGIFHGRSRLRARGLIDTDVTDTLTTLNNLTALLHRFAHLRERERKREREEQRLCETKDRFGNGLKGDFDPPLCEPFCVSYETRCV